MCLEGVFAVSGKASDAWHLTQTHSSSDKLMRCQRRLPCHSSRHADRQTRCNGLLIKQQRSTLRLLDRAPNYARSPRSYFIRRQRSIALSAAKQPSSEAVPETNTAGLPIPSQLADILPRELNLDLKFENFSPSGYAVHGAPAQTC